MANILSAPLLVSEALEISVPVEVVEQVIPEKEEILPSVEPGQ